MVSVARSRYDAAFAAMPLVAILRGITPAEVEAVADALVSAGFTLIEVPLNSPDPFDSITRLVRHCPEGVAVGAGTVLRPEDAERLADTGAHYMVTPNTDPRVITAAGRRGLASMVGCMTPTEALAAAQAGATALKLFPAGRLGPGYLKDLRAVLPPTLPVCAVGGIGVPEMEPFATAGAAGFGYGGVLWTPGAAPDAVAAKAAPLVAEWRRLAGGGGTP